MMLRNCFLDFAVKHWFGCHATEPGIAGEIGGIEIWLTDQYDETVRMVSSPPAIRDTT